MCKEETWFLHVIPLRTNIALSITNLIHQLICILLKGNFFPNIICIHTEYMRCILYRILVFQRNHVQHGEDISDYLNPSSSYTQGMPKELRIIRKKLPKKIHFNRSIIFLYMVLDQHNFLDERIFKYFLLIFWIAIHCKLLYAKRHQLLIIG